MPAREPNIHAISAIGARSRRWSVLLGGCTLVLCGVMMAGTGEQGLEPATGSSGESQTIPAGPLGEDSVAQECVVTFLTGRTLTGILMDSNEDNLVLRINGIDTTYRRARIASVKFLPPVETRFRTFRAALPDDDIEGRLLLVDWLRDRRAYELAIEELGSILEVEPNNPQAKLLKTWLEEHLKLSKARESEPETSIESKERHSNRRKMPVLSEEQINLIRVYEIDLTNPPRLLVDESTVEELMRRSPDAFPVEQSERVKLLKGSNLDRLKLLFRHKARDLYPQIQVLEDPESFENFKQYIAGRNGWLSNGCATARCHGGEDAGELRLVGTSTGSDATVYSNFLILERFKLRDGTPLINYGDPERSPLVQMGLPRPRSLYPHPEVDPTRFGRDWRPIFRTTKSLNFQHSVEWIRSLYTPRPEYGFEYPPKDEGAPPAMEPSP